MESAATRESLEGVQKLRHPVIAQRTNLIEKPTNEDMFLSQDKTIIFLIIFSIRK